MSLELHQQAERETNATIKLVLAQMEELASLPPAQANEPYAFEERRQLVMRKIWGLVKQCLKNVPRPVHEV